MSEPDWDAGTETRYESRLRPWPHGYCDECGAPLDEDGCCSVCDEEEDA